MAHKGIAKYDEVLAKWMEKTNKGEQAGPEPKFEQFTREGSALAQVVNLAVLVLLAPAFEELLFRGFLLSALHRAFGALAALVVSGAAFGLIHLQPAGLPTLTVLGLVLGLARLRTGSLLPPILMHAAWNGGVFLLMWTLVG